MRAHRERASFVFLAITLFASCSPGPSARTCPNSVTLTEVSGQHAPGGVLTFENAEARKVWRCTVSLRFSLGNQLEIVTAKHCSPHDLVDRTMLELDTEEGYVSIPLVVEEFERAKRLRRFPGLSAAARAYVAQAFKPTLASFDANNPEIPDVVVASYDDLEVLKVTPSLETPEAMAALESAKALWGRLPKAPSLASADLQKWYDLQIRFQKLSQDAATANWIETILDCSGKAQNVCAEKGVMFSALSKELGLVAGSTLLVSPTLREKAKADLAAIKAERKVFWQNIISPKYLVATPQMVSFQTNITPGNPQAVPRFGSIPALQAGFGDALKDPVHGGLFIDQDANRVLKLQYGDSGSLFAIGAYPLVAVSTLKFRPSSEGASLMPLPRARPRAQGVGALAGQPQNVAPTPGMQQAALCR